MQVVVNTRLLIKDKLDGMGWFAYQTLQRICRNQPDVHFVFLFDRPYDEMFIFSDNITPIVLSPPARHPFLYYTWFEISVKGLLNKLMPDLFLSPDGFLSLGAKCRQLPVIHDINFLHYPSHSKWLTSKYYNHFFPRFAKKATRIATVSEFSRNDISNAYHVDALKIDVVYNGINSFFSPVSEAGRLKTRMRFSDGKEYFVYVGSLHPRKNIASLVKAFSLFKKRSGSPVKLVLAGPGYWGLAEINATISKEGLNNEVILTGRLSDEELAEVLGSALALTFVPYFEGFGIPLLEAMAAEVPIIASNLTSIPEVTGGAALLVDPNLTEEIAGAMIKMHEDPLLRNLLVAKGREQKLKFSWDRSADLLWQSMLKAMQ